MKLAGFSETSQKHCSMDFDATSQGGIGNLAFAAMTVEHASPAFFQGTVAARQVLHHFIFLAQQQVCQLYVCVSVNYI